MVGCLSFCLAVRLLAVALLSLRCFRSVVVFGCCFRVFFGLFLGVAFAGCIGEICLPSGK